MQNAGRGFSQQAAESFAILPGRHAGLATRPACYTLPAFKTSQPVTRADVFARSCLRPGRTMLIVMTG